MLIKIRVKMLIAIAPGHIFLQQTKTCLSIEIKAVNDFGRSFTIIWFHFKKLVLVNQALVFV